MAGIHASSQNLVALLSRFDLCGTRQTRHGGKSGFRRGAPAGETAALQHYWFCTAVAGDHNLNANLRQHAATTEAF